METHKTQQGKAQHVALVTGGAVRIGAAIVRLLASNGWTVAIHYHQSQKQAEALASRMEQEGRRACPFQADLRKPEQCEKLFMELCRTLGPVRAVINNASCYLRDSQSSPIAWEESQAVHVKAPLSLSTALANQSSLPDKACIVNMIDQRCLPPARQDCKYYSYGESKTALMEQTLDLAKKLAPNIRVCAIAPGPTYKNVDQSSSDFHSETQTTPLLRPVDQNDIAQLVKFLLEAPSMTGAIIPVDCGQHLNRPPV